MVGSYPVIWFVLALAFLILEVGTVALVSVWFAVGAAAAAVAAMLGGPFWVQAVVFLAVTGLLLALLRPIFRKYVRITRTNVDSVIGSQGYVTADIDNIAAHGSVKLGAMDWTARSTSGEIIPAGTCIRVDRIEGVKVYVTPVKIAETVYSSQN